MATEKRQPAAKSRPKAEAVDVEDPTVTADATTFVQKKELIDRIVAATGMKKKDVKPVVEATLAALGEALSRGEALNVRPLGKVQVNRKKEHGNAEVLTARIRRITGGETAPQDPLAEVAE
ncbi:HU family DNA-binding protein [Actibacterium sp.]|uniref:HU family DNA-binding protein n=1 Tax=Actibacterium sp. TaxID=1872125 RepID=UPI0035629E42